MDLNNVFAENLKRIRTGKGLTQGELGDAIGYSNKAVSKWESGLSQFRLTVTSGET